MDSRSGRNGDTSPGNLVAQVNNVAEEEPIDVGDWAEPVVDPGVEEAPDIPTKTPILQAVFLGVVALIVIAISMFLLLQGVFEMIPS